MPQLLQVAIVQCPATGGGDEELLGPPVGEPGPTGLRAEVLEELMEASFANSERLIDDASLLLEASRFPTSPPHTWLPC
jgi:hypothetical protein